MKNAVQRGEVINIPNIAAAYVSGKAYVVGEFVGVAENNAAIGATGVLTLKGAYTLGKITGALTQGAKVYWDPAATALDGTLGAITGTIGSLKQIGWCLNAAQSGDLNVDVLLGKG